MEKRGVIVFCLLTLMYFIGAVAGSICQVKLTDQSEMYQYLTNAVAGYELNVWESFKASMTDNTAEFAVLLIASFLPFGAWIVGIALSVRGFLTAFAVTASMRIYGAWGLLLNAGSILSALLVIPVYVCFGRFLHMDSGGKKGFKFALVSSVFLSAVLFVDCVMKGVVSPYIVKLWK